MIVRLLRGRLPHFFEHGFVRPICSEDARRNVASLDAAIAVQLAAAPVPRPPAAKTCTGRNGRAISCGDSTTAQQIYAAARKDYEATLASLREQRRAARVRVIALAPSPQRARRNELLAAKRADAAEAAQSPMHRIDAAVFGTGVAAISPEPLLIAARFLLEGSYAQPSDYIETWHLGSAHISLRATVGVAAALTVQERDNGKHPQRLVPYVPFDKGMFASCEDAFG